MYNDFENKFKNLLTSILLYDSNNDNDDSIKRLICDRCNELAGYIKDNEANLGNRSQYLKDLLCDIYIFIANH